MSVKWELHSLKINIFHDVTSTLFIPLRCVRFYLITFGLAITVIIVNSGSNLKASMESYYDIILK